MTVRVRDHGEIRIYAGTRDELAAIANAYARGDRERPEGCAPDLFRRVAAELCTGHPVHNLGPVRFYSDRSDGAPFQGPLAPEPDPEWLARQIALSEAPAATRPTDRPAPDPGRLVTTHRKAAP